MNTLLCVNPPKLLEKNYFNANINKNKLYEIQIVKFHKRIVLTIFSHFPKQICYKNNLKKTKKANTLLLGLEMFEIEPFILTYKVK